MHKVVTNPHFSSKPDEWNFSYAEMCEYCGEDVPIVIDESDKTYEVTCPHCGKKMMLCSLCIDDFGECAKLNGKCICKCTQQEIEDYMEENA